MKKNNQEKKQTNKKNIKQNHKRLSLYGLEPDKAFKVFMQIPIDKILAQKKDDKYK